MLIIQRLIYRQIISGTILFSAGLIMLFILFGLSDEISNVGSGINGSYSSFNALIYVSLSSLINLQEILPISVLIAAIYVLSKLAINSEFTILRTSGLSPTNMLKMLLLLGVAMSVAIFLFSDYASPKIEQYAEQYKLKSKGQYQIQPNHLAWLKTQDSEFNYIVNIESLDFNNNLTNISIYSFNQQGVLVSEIKAEHASLEHHAWLLQQVSFTSYPSSADNQTISHQQLEQYTWHNNISLELIKASFIKPNRMNIIALYHYSQHLKANNQEAQNYQIAFWRKIFSSLNAIVMLILAMPFAYLHFRNSNIYFYIFIGVIIGLSFFMLSTITEHLTKINHWTPWLASMIPSLIYTAVSMYLFNWLVKNR